MRAVVSIGIVLFLTIAAMSSASASETHTIEKVAKEDLKPGPATPGIVRRIAFQENGTTTVLAESEPGMVSAWHNHTDHDVYGYVVSGAIRFEFGDSMVTLGPGDFFHVPPHTVHREFNPSSTEKGKVVLFITGSGPLVENVDDPNVQ